MQLTTLPLALGALLLLPTSVSASRCNGTQPNKPTPDEDGKYWIYSDHLTAGFVPYGAAISDLIINDQYGIPRDIVAGWDNASYYSIDEQHPNYGNVPGRYANRIKNSTFEIDGVTFHVEPNENPTDNHPDGVNTLHGGPDGWGWRNFTVVSHTENSITFSIVDPDGKEGFPGEVISYVTYTVTDWDWDISIVALSTTEKTPIMLTSHAYWNLDGFANNETNLAHNHTLHLPYSGQRVAVDDILIPTGEILANEKGSVNDFWSAPKPLGANITSPDLEGNCGAGCTGYDNCYTVNREGSYDWRSADGYVARVHSPWSGIQLDIYSDQDAFQVYSCTQQDGTLALKRSQGLWDEEAFPRTIPQYGCVVLEVQDYIDGINNPAWGRTEKQIFGPADGPYVLRATYRFSINSESS
ncbi:hypothetical protein ACRALDRAFT_2097061 [Sodiomyces alcalophilus JCM 7366]|uniref:uncharacterized protein n=1 Tax=Sodiomyces alcalophilus JCM 7366 TaxID=591952 RepID=UPI0039B4E11E